ncbi:MAG: putative sugar nucleotidyl transferase [Candidatus Brocadiaceae bacterium]|nr:putative sugar nucleotidyl transferase [Candidatus Brocadiaceae bacterium]
MNGICIFEDSGYSGLLPLVYTRPVYHLRCGILSLEEKILHQYPGTSVSLFCRDYLADVLKEISKQRINTLDTGAEGYLFVNGRLLECEQIPLEGPEEIGLSGNTLVYARVGKERNRELLPGDFLEDKALEKLEGLPRKEVSPALINYFWDIIKHNKEETKKDWQRVGTGLPRPCRGINGRVYEGVSLLNAGNIFTGSDSRIKPGCVLDAEDGPIFIAEEVLIQPNTTIVGPAYIGKGAIVRPSTRLREGSSVGEYCKVGGEISNSILHSYSNKQHDGFLGDSYIGSWVNLGAGTTNSNLKNTYGNIRVQFGDRMIDSGETFLGVAIGDHTKVGINSSFSAGGIVGFSCNVIGRYPVPRFVPSFSWCAERIQTYHLDNALEVARRTMSRRGKILSGAEEALFQEIHELTQEARGMTPYI